jgi:flagellar hook protein FlgE
MLRSLNSGVSAMQQFQERMDVIGNNVANVNTTGYKSARVDFSDTLSQTLRGAGPAGTMQVGTGVTTSSITNQFVQGAIARTGSQTDLAISGEGFFEVQDATTGAQFLTRAGEFHLNENGYLTTSTGLRVQGYSDSGLATVGDIQIDGTGSGAAAGATAGSYSIGTDGIVNVRMSDGTEFVRGQVLLQTVRAPQALMKEGNNLFSGLTAAGALATPVAPGSAGLGRLLSGALEMSNVDLANEFSSLITTQRAFQASARIITTSDEMLQEMVNLKR